MNDTNKKKKNSKQRRVLIASIILAGVITIGGTFAWFTSKDEVTNRLTASNNYGVSIVEDFTPPSNWVPGQEVDKAVRVTNTGNIDAFVKVSLSNFIDLTVSSVSSEKYNTISSLPSLKTGEKFVTLSGKSEDDADEILSLQAGGRLVCEAGTKISDESKQIEDGTNYKPTATGMYIFERNVDSGTIVYEGYYYVAETSDSGGQGTYYPLSDIRKSNDSAGFYAKFKTTTTLTNQDLTFETNDDSFIFSETVGDVINYYLKAKYTGTNGDIIIRIYLADDYTDNWSCQLTKANSDDTTATVPTFYLKEILAGGATSENLIKSLELDSEVKASAYVSFDYNLKVTADSVQVVYDNEGKIFDGSDEAVDIEWGSDPADATVNVSSDDDTVTVEWSFSSETPDIAY